MARRAFTIGGLIYGGFLLLIVLIVGASVAGILALRQIDASFAQVKDLAAVSKRGADLRNDAATLLRDAGAYAGDPTDARRKQVWAAAAGIKAEYFAISVERKIRNPAVAEMIERARDAFASIRSPKAG